MTSTPRPMATSALSSAPSPSGSSYFKGKNARRSWAQLPADLVRLIATFFIYELRMSNHTPQLWEAAELWQQRMMYCVLRDVPEIMKIMSVCPAWGMAIEYHDFWDSARHIIDPQNCFQHLAFAKPPQQLNSSSTQAASAALIPVSPFHHYNRISHLSCHVCRVNAPWTSFGLGAVKRQLYTPTLGTLYACREHRKGSFCGLCLRAPQIHNPDSQILIGCHENEDDETWPGVDATCRICRAEWLWRRVAADPWLKEAVGGRQFAPADWESRFVVDAFIDNADGSITDVLMLASEKLWLRKNTRLQDLLRVAVLSTRYNLRFRNQREEEEEEEDDLEDPELLSITEEREGVRELAMSDWARARIMDGHWLSPADSWYRHSVAGRPTHVRAVHPCPWTDDSVLDNLDQHPREEVVNSAIPPTFASCEQAFRAFGKQMRLILKPAMENVVRKLVIECTADGVDPAVKAARMHIEDVVAELREEGVWYNGMDWLEHRRNMRADAEKQRQRAREEARSVKGGIRDDDAESDSSSSSKSNATSPVLSTTTVQTTPSPPPSTSDKDSEEEMMAIPQRRPITIPVAPVLNPPVLLQHIPFIPITTHHLPQYSIESLRSIWREACAPLYHCRCRICERAMVKGAATTAAIVGTPASVPTDPAILREQQERYHRLQQENQRKEEERQAFAQKLDAVKQVPDNEIDVESDGYSEDDLSPSEEGFASDDDYVDGLDSPIRLYPVDSNAPRLEPAALKPVVAIGDIQTQRSRKRSCDEVDGDNVEDVASAVAGDKHRDSLPSPKLPRSELSRTPPKRPKLELETCQQSGPYTSDVAEITPSRLKKRGSEELDSGGRYGTTTDFVQPTNFKKAKLQSPDDTQIYGRNINGDSGRPTVERRHAGTQEGPEPCPQKPPIHKTPSLNIEGLYTLDKDD